MKKPIPLIILLLTTVSIFSQETSVTKPSGATITLNNPLPETVRDAFTVETLADRFPDDYPFDIWAMIALQDQDKLMLVAKVMYYRPAEDKGIGRLFIMENERLPFSVLSLLGPEKLMGKLSAWYQTQSRTLSSKYINTPYFPIPQYSSLHMKRVRMNASSSMVDIPVVNCM